MLGQIAFQRAGATVSPSLTTTTVAGAVSLQVSGYGICEIVNTSATISAAFLFTASGPTVAATATARVIPPLTTLYEQLPQGAQSVSALELTTGTPVLYFTPGTLQR